jgi:hypothetical protein
MTRQRNDEHSTEFGLWLRRQRDISSELGFVATNLDYIWENYKTGDWMLLEEKRHGSQPTFSQRKLFTKIHGACKADPQYHGIHLLVFENTSPEDGKMWLDNKVITVDELLAFLQFETGG